MMLSGIASAIAGHVVKVRLDPNLSTAYFDHGNSIIAVNYHAPYEAQRGFIAHELGHEAFTTERAWNSLTDETRAYGNLCEDMRINLHKSKHLFKSAQTWIMQTWDWLRGLESGGVFKKGKPSFTCLYMAHNQPHAPAPWDADSQAWIDRYLTSVLAASGVDTMTDAIEALRALDEKYQGKTDPGKQPEKPERPSPTGPKGGKKTLKQQRQDRIDYQKALEQHQQAVKRANALKHGKSPFHGDGEFVPAGDPAGDKPGEQSGYSGQSGKLQGERQGAGKYGVSDSVPQEVLDHLRSWRNRVAEALMSEDRSAPSRNLPRGRLDGSRLHHVTAGTSDRVFTKPGEPRRAVNTAIDILVDQSGSTCGQVSQYIAASAYALAEAVSRVPGVQMGILGYDSQPCNLMPVGHNRGAKLEQAQVMALGGTETNAIVLMSAGRLRAAYGARRHICINMTDGAAAAQETWDLVEEMGIEYYEIHIYPNQLAVDRHAYEADAKKLHVRAENIHQGLDGLIRTLQIQGR